MTTNKSFKQKSPAFGIGLAMLAAVSVQAQEAATTPDDQAAELANPYCS